MDNLRRTMSVNYRDITQFTSASSDFSTTSIGATIDYSYPISEYQSLSFGASFNHAELASSFRSTQQAQDWVANNGNQFSEDLGNGSTLNGTEFDSLELIVGWSYDSRNRSLFATAGTRQQIFLTTTVPGSDVEYY